MKISLVVAYDDDYVIGKDNKLPWNLPEDLKWFKEITENNTICMGLNTWESLPPKVKPLPKRENIIVSTTAKFRSDIVPGTVTIFDNHIDALLYAQLHNKDLYVIGGSRLYDSVLPYADKLYITHVYGSHPGDTYFPKIDLRKDWYRISRRKFETHESCIYIRRKKNKLSL